jgi:hypothetical protein
MLPHFCKSSRADTRLCVAPAAMRNLPAARVTCDAAVAAEEPAMHVGLSAWKLHARPHPNRQLALAYLTRAVLDDVALEQAAAARDLDAMSSA